MRGSALCIERSRSGMPTTTCAPSKHWRQSPPNGPAISLPSSSQSSSITSSASSIWDLAFAPTCDASNPPTRTDSDFLAMAAFASELCGDYADAEARAERALGIEPRNPWAQHALSHVLIRRGRVREGLARLEP